MPAQPVCITSARWVPQRELPRGAPVGHESVPPGPRYPRDADRDEEAAPAVFPPVAPAAIFPAVLPAAIFPAVLPAAAPAAAPAVATPTAAAPEEELTEDAPEQELTEDVYLLSGRLAYVLEYGKKGWMYVQLDGEEGPDGPPHFRKSVRRCQLMKDK